MLVSEREAAGILAGAGLAREPARRLLKAGFAGVPLRTRSALLYDEDRVRELVEREPVTERELAATCPRGAFVLRMGQGVDVAAPFTEQLDRLRLTWWLSPWARVRIGDAVRRRGWYPFLVTVSGFVAFAGDVTDLVPSDGDRDTSLVVADPSGWAEALPGRRLAHRGAGPWMLWPTPARLQQ